MSDKIYWLGPGMLRGKGDALLAAGDEIPPGTMYEDEIRAHVAAGRVRIGEADSEEPAPVDNREPPKNWAFDPEELVDKELVDLNMLIADHAEKIGVVAPEPFDTAEEAVAYLTQDR